MIRVSHIFETILYAEDLEAAEEFYVQGFGLNLIDRNELLLALGCDSGVLLIFDPRKSRVPGRPVPSHGTVGEGHIAFATHPEDLPAWRKQLSDAKISIESEIQWESGGTSLYVRDPAGNSVELAPPSLWGDQWSFPKMGS